MKPIRGVNVAGWLVAERWITPSLFDPYGAVDEESLAGAVGKDKFKKLINTHRDTFITEADFQRISQRGFNSVRIQIPWYIFDGTGHPDRHIPCITYLDNAFSWAEKNGLTILLTLHTVPGGHTFRLGDRKSKQLAWHLRDEYREITLLVIEKLAQRYCGHSSFFGIELLDAPALKTINGLHVSRGVPTHVLRNFYRKGYAAVRKSCNTDVAVIVHDSYHPKSWASFMTSKNYENVWMSLHRYHFLYPKSDEIHHNDELWKRMQHEKKLLKKLSKRRKKILISEWSGGLAIPNEAMLPEARAAFERMFIRGQMDAYSLADGWYFYTYKTEREIPNWDARKALSFFERGMIHG